MNVVNRGVQAVRYAFNIIRDLSRVLGKPVIVLTLAAGLVWYGRPASLLRGRR
jgi:hypothetical protein